MRVQLLGDISAFLLQHHLPVNSFTLCVAHDYITHADGHMVRAIDRRLQAREPLTLEWMEQAARENTPDQRETFSRLMGKLEHNIEEFGRTTTAAKSAANAYNSALEAHVDELGDAAPRPPSADHAADVLGELVALARAMLSRTRELEQDLARNMLQTRSLRRSLDAARRSAEKDHLTGLPNRRAFENRYALDIAVARAAHEHLCVAFCDIDHFKRINDEHGHEAGDRVLKSVATSLARISNDRCHVARHGGEEFVILLRGRSLHEAWDILEDARQQLAERRLVNRSTDTPFGKITLSGGIADVFAFADPRAALRAADKALYRAKAEGRNRMLIAERETA